MNKAIIIASLITWGAIIISYLITHKGEYRKKRRRQEREGYECGIEIIEEKKGIETQERIKIEYFYIAIIFLIFDLEILLIIPGITKISVFTYWMVIIIIYVISLGVIYEYKKKII